MTWSKRGSSLISSKKITRVGGTREIVIDTRIISASNKKLDKLVSEGQFRADLYYRLNVIPIEIPPLRDRPEDLWAATKYFFNKYNKKYGKCIKIDNQQLNELLHYNWPGNLRELENYVERTVVTSKEDNEIADVVLSNSLSCSGSRKKQTLNDALEQLEKSMVIEAYEKHKNSYKVAEELGISQPSAHRKITKYVDSKIR